MILKGLVDRDDIGRLSRCGRERSERRECEERDKSDRLAVRSRYNDLTPLHCLMARRDNTRRKGEKLLKSQF
jgi:hypothetical protein